MSEPANEPDGDGGERAPADWPREGRIRVDGIGDLTAVGTGGGDGTDASDASDDVRRAVDRLLAALDRAEEGGGGGAGYGDGGGGQGDDGTGDDVPEADADRGFEAVQEAVAAEYDLLFGTDGWSGRGADAGLTWMDFAYVPETAPPQVVGHSRQPRPTRTGEVVCGNVIRSTRGSPGGEAVLVETPDELVAVRRDERGEVAVLSV